MSLHLDTLDTFDDPDVALATYFGADAAAFGGPPDPAQLAVKAQIVDPARYVLARWDGEAVGGTGSYDLELTLPGVAKDERRELALAKHLLQPPQKVGHGCGGHDDVFDERHWPHDGPDAGECREHVAGEFPEEGGIGRVVGPSGVETGPAPPLRRGEGIVEPGVASLRIVARELDEQPCLGDRRNEQIERRLRAPGECEVPLVEEIAGARFERPDAKGRLGGLVQRVEEQQPQRRRAIGGHDPQRGLGDDRQGALRAADQPRQIDEAIMHEIMKTVAAM